MVGYKTYTLTVILVAVMMMTMLTPTAQSSPTTVDSEMDTFPSAFKEESQQNVRPLLLPPVVEKQGAAFTVPNILNQEIENYVDSLSIFIRPLLPGIIDKFILASPDSLDLVIASSSGIGYADVQGYQLFDNIELAGVEVGVIISTSVNFNDIGEEATVEDILNDPVHYRNKLVKIDGHRNHLSVLYDYDGFPGQARPLTLGQLSDDPIPSSGVFRQALARGGEFLETPSRDIAQDILEDEHDYLQVISFQESYWIEAPVITNGIVLNPSGSLFDFLENLIPDADELVKLREGSPILYDINTVIKTDFSPATVNEIKDDPEKYIGKVVELTVKAYGGSISSQKHLHEKGIPAPIDAVFEGVVAWNTLTMPILSNQTLMAVGASSAPQDVVFEQFYGEYDIIGKVVSPEEIDMSINDTMVLIVYSREKINLIDYDSIMDGAKTIIELYQRQLNWIITGFTDQRIDGVPISYPETLFRPDRTLFAENPTELPEMIHAGESLQINISSHIPAHPLNLSLDNSTISRIIIEVKETKEDLVLSFTKDVPSQYVSFAAPGFIHSYCNISYNVADSELENAEIHFRVEKEGMESRGVEYDDIVMLRQKQGEWIELELSLVDENESYWEFKAITPGFSTFAVTANVTIDGISIENLPELISYQYGEDIDFNGLIVNLSLSNGGYNLVGFADFGDEIIVSPNQGQTLTHASSLVTVTHSESAEFATFEIGIAAIVTSIVVTEQPKLIYDVGEVLDLSDLVVNLTWTNGSWNLIPFTEFGANGLGVSLTNGAPLTETEHNGIVIVVTHTSNDITGSTGAIGVQSAQTEEPAAEGEVCAVPFALMFFIGMVAISTRRR